MGLVSLNRFLKLESASGIILLAAALLALLFENSPLSWIYDAIRDLPFSIQLGDLALSKPLLLWVNDGLMAIFFLLVGLELKREVLDGQLRSRAQILLPLTAACGGICIPALVFWIFTRNSPELLEGWAIPSTTDIAFALGVLMLFGSRVPLSLKVFLTALAIFDDLAAIVIIACFYTADLSYLALGAALLWSTILYILNRTRVFALAPYIIVGILLWIAVLKSGVHATLAGVVVALAIPFRADSPGNSPLKQLEHALHPWVAYGVLPLFAFFNAGVNLISMEPGSLTHPLTLAVMIGLFIGKQLGAFGASFLLIKLGFAELPEQMTWSRLYAICVLSGVGFTMSLFIGTLAFSQAAQLSYVRYGVLAGSFLSSLLAIVLLHRFLPHSQIE